MSFRKYPRPRSRQISKACIETLEARQLLSFSPTASFPVGRNPQDVVTADFNNDGKLDLATTSYDDATGDGSVSVLLGNGSGSFQTARTFATAPYTFALATGDFNADGKIDLATANNGGVENNDVSILLGKGDGTFAPAVGFGAPYAWSITAGDVNADGKLDLVTTADDGWGYDAVSVLLGHGDGSFAAPITYDSYYGQVFTPTLADFNGDGNVDVAVAGWQMYGAIVYLGNGDGTLQDPTFYENNTIAGSNSITAGDFNADGKIDLVTSNYMTNSATVFLGSGDGSFIVPPRTFGAGNAPGSATTADVNADGKLDLIVTNQSSAGGISVLLGDGLGGLAAPITAAGPASSLAIADFSGDGRPDAAATNLGSSSVAILLNDGNWTVQPTRPQITISDVTKAEGKNKTTTSFTFTVSLSAASNQPVTVSYRSVNNTATAGSDYASATGTITFAPGQTTKTITIQVKGDKQRESNETFYLELFNNSSNSLISKPRGVGTILNDD